MGARLSAYPALVVDWTHACWSYPAMDRAHEPTGCGRHLRGGRSRHVSRSLESRHASEGRADMKLSVISCYALAWRSFSKWWMPICVISGIMVVLQVIPRIVVRADMTELEITARRLVTAVLEDDHVALEKIAPKVAAQTGLLTRRFTTYGLCLFPLVALLTDIECVTPGELP